MIVLWFQAKMYRALATLLLMFDLVRAYPGGSPSCTARPGHGGNYGVVYGEVTNIGGNNWQVCNCGKFSAMFSHLKRVVKMNPALDVICN